LKDKFIEDEAKSISYNVDYSIPFILLLQS